MYTIRIWKWLDDTHKRLMETYTSDNLDFMQECYELDLELYNFWNYEVEKVGF